MAVPSESTLSPNYTLIDVNDSFKEIITKSDSACDSGMDTNSSYSNLILNPSSRLGIDCNDLDSIRCKLDVEDSEDVSSACFSSRNSATPEVDTNNGNSPKCHVLPTHDNSNQEQFKSYSTEQNHAVCEMDVQTISITNNNSIIFPSSDNIPHAASASQSIRQTERSEDVNLHQDKLENSNLSQMHTKSLLSLNDQVNSTDIPRLTKSSLSKSVENLHINNVNTDKSQFSTSTGSSGFNTDKILAEFTNHKLRVGATQKILPENIQTNIDLIHSRLPKEILTQDFGSIVKNVHGIFSSVSGSLKHAYNISNRASVQKPVSRPWKPVPNNSKIMNEIFEEDVKALENIETDSVKTLVSQDQDIKPVVTAQEFQDSESNAKNDVVKLQIESLERMLSEQRKEMSVLRNRVREQTNDLLEKDQTFKDLEGKLDLMRKRVEQAEREKDAAVMRYASSECAVIEARRAAEAATKTERSATAELELMAGKLKSAHAEKQRICQLYDNKCHELMNSERELAKAREELKELEGRLKWTQSKLRMEMDAYKDSAEKVEKLTQQVSELEAAKEAATTNAIDSVKAKQLESELKESQASLILCRHEKVELEKRVASLLQQLETCRNEKDIATSSLARTTAEVMQLRESNMRLEEEAASLAALSARAALADTLSSQLQRETERATQLEEALQAERARAETCARREASALEHAASLTAHHVAERAALGNTAAKVQALGADNASLRERLCSLEGELTRAQSALNEEVERRNRENRVLARKVAELTEELSETSQKLEWEKGENGVLKKKHASAIRELNRELQRALKRCEQLEAKIPPVANGDSTRAGSVTSLSSSESVAVATEERLHNGHSNETVPEIQVCSPDRQALIERIVSLQRAAARRAERCDFLEEHSKQLTDELRNKSKLLRQLLCSTPAGALTDNSCDDHKKEIARLGGGAMAAVWGGDPTGMTLELSLEMNKKLQAVLEDTLLKNITLKENMDTLGREIARLKGQPLKPSNET